MNSELNVLQNKERNEILSEKEYQKLREAERLNTRKANLKKLVVPLVRLEDMELEKELKSYLQKQQKQQKQVKFPDGNEAIAIDNQGYKYRLSKSFEKTGKGQRHKEIDENQDALSLEDTTTQEEASKQTKALDEKRKSHRIAERQNKELQDKLNGIVKESDFVYDFGKKKKTKVLPKLVTIKILKKKDKEALENSSEFKERQRNANEMQEIRKTSEKLERAQERKIKLSKLAEKLKLKKKQ